SEVVSAVQSRRPVLLCIGALPPGGIPQARHICKRVRAQVADLKVVVGRWDTRTEDFNGEVFEAAGADRVATSLLECRDQILELLRATPGAADPALAS